MKILLLPSYFHPEGVASPYISQNRNQRFADEGWDMVVYTPTPSRGIPPNVRKEYLKKEHRIEKALDGHLVVHRFRLVEEGQNPIIRAFRYFAQNIKQFNRAVFGKDARKCNVMLIASTPPTQGAMAAMVKKFRHIPLVYNLQDIFPDSLVSTGMTHEDSFLWKIGRCIENFTYRNADKIIVISQDFKRNIMAKGVPEEKIEVIYNWVDQNAVVDIPRSENKLFDMYCLDRSKFYVTYNGNIGLTQNMEMLCEVARELEASHTDIHFVLVGNGAYWDTMVAKLKREKEEIRTKASDGTEAITFGNISLLPFQPYEDIGNVFSLGDVSLVISKPGVGENSVPSKTWSIMSASRPVLANFDENELKTIIIDHHCGIFTKAGDKEAFKDAILTLYNHRELCKEYGRNGRQFILENLTREVGTGRYVEVIRQVAGER
jgi:glycosyltransferase involved in cell wall biosynthesis